MIEQWDKHMAKKFTVDARTILTLGRDSIKDHTTALVELVKNSYDADATCVEIEILGHRDSMFGISAGREPYIRVADNGSGMTEADINESWLRIGYSGKRQEKVSAKGRRKTGEKGIGRISSDRLGAVLELRTKTQSEGIHSLVINWNSFERDVPLSEIEVDEINNPQINIPEGGQDESHLSGTELIITQLRQEWTKQDIDNLHRELSMLMSPFDKGIDFTIRLKTDELGFEELTGSEVFENFMSSVDVYYDGTSEDIRYEITQRNHRDTSVLHKYHGSIRWNQLVHDFNDYQANRRFGPVRLKLMYYPQTAALLEGAGFNLSHLRSFLKNNAGVRIYRDSIRVKPYGNLDTVDGDWLGLGEAVARNPAGAGRRSFLIRPTQLVGAVFISRDGNPALTDSSAREGLIHGEAFVALREFVRGFVRVLSVEYHTAFQENKERERQPLSPSEEVRFLRQQLTLLRRELRDIRPLLLGDTEDQVDATAAEVDKAVALLGEAGKSIEQLERQAINFRGLATVGIASTVFAHEIQMPLSQLLISISNAQGYIEVEPPQLKKISRYLADSKEYSNRVSVWSRFVLDRVRRDKRREKKVDVDAIVANLISELEPIINDIGVKIAVSVEPVRTRAFAMDIETVLLNLVTNAFEAVRHKQKNRKISVVLRNAFHDGQHGYELSVSDSGPGVPSRFREEIWKPLFSTKAALIGQKRTQTGTGLGLTIVQSVVDDHKGWRHVDSDPELKGARFIVWFPMKEY